jgi:hypothetical protein
MKNGERVTILILGIVVGLLLYGYLFPKPEIPPPIYIPGVPDTVYQEIFLTDTVTFTTKDTVIIVDGEPEVYEAVDSTVALYDDRVQIRVRALAKDLRYLEVIGLSFVETVISVTDTIHTHVPVEIPPPWYKSFTFGVGVGATVAWLIFWAVSQLYTINI